MKHQPARSARRALALLAITASLAGGLSTGALLAASTQVGLHVQRSELWENENLFFYLPQAHDLFGWSVVSGDFNCDGVDDLATGMPLDDGLLNSEVPDSGAVIVRYGVRHHGLAGGLATTVLNQYPGGYPNPDQGDRYGYALAAGDFNGDACDDLAAGVPNEPCCGGVAIHYGLPSGIQYPAEHFLKPGLDGVPLAFGNFGRALAAGDFNGDNYDDLAVGAPFDYANPAVTHTGGRVVVLHGHYGGFLPVEGYLVTQDEPEMVDGSESGDLFGYALAAGDFDGSGHDDLAIGVPGENGAGAVQVLFGSQWSLLFVANGLWVQSELGGTTDAGDSFGAALTVGNFDGDAHQDLVIGAPNDDVVLATGSGPLTFLDAGSLSVMYGSPSWFDVGRSQHWIDDDLLDATEDYAGDHFGGALAAGDFDRDGAGDLAVGLPQDFGNDIGSVMVVSGQHAVGLTGTRRRRLIEGYEGVVGDLEASVKRFGFALASGDFDGSGDFVAEDDLAIGMPYREVGGVAAAGAEVVVYAYTDLLSDGFETKPAPLAPWTDVEP
jgi:hypothetical protein